MSFNLAGCSWGFFCVFFFFGGGGFWVFSFFFFRFSLCFQNVLKWRMEKTKQLSFEVALGGIGL